MNDAQFKSALAAVLLRWIAEGASREECDRALQASAVRAMTSVKTPPRVPWDRVRAIHQELLAELFSGSVITPSQN